MSSEFLDKDRSTTVRSLRLALGLLCLVAFLGSPQVGSAAESGLNEGDRVLVTGTVRDESGQPAADLQVTLQGSRQKLNLRSLTRDDTDHRQRNTFTDADGRYTIEWTWYDFYNRFEIFAGEVMSDGQLAVMARADLTERMKRGGPIVWDLDFQTEEPEKRSKLGSLLNRRKDRDTGSSSEPRTASAARATSDASPAAREIEPASEFQRVAPSTATARSTRASQFVSDLDSDDERKIYDRFGQPDTVKRFRYPNYLEVSWWYFREGKAYTFREGQLEREFDFDPVVPF